MNIQELVDELYQAFADKLEPSLRAIALDLPRALRLAPEPDMPWSRVFSHEVTLGAPALFAESMPVTSAQVREAVLAHLLAVVEAFGTDRIEDKQVEPTPAVLAVLDQARRDRTLAIERLFGGRPPDSVGFATADVETTQAIRHERELLASARPVSFDVYEHASLAKQSAGLVASVALARAARCDERRCSAVQRTLESVALGLQMYDDVVDWEDDVARGGSWAVCLTRGAEIAQPRRDDARLDVLASGVLHAMLVRAMHHMRAARRRAAGLGAGRLVAWAESREARLRALVSAELRSAGYAVRAHALAAWAGEVLA
jgi:hypothetical protein